MKEHIKLVDRLSDPLDRLIPQILHLSEEQISGEPNLACFICVRVHGFLACNPSFCKKNSRGTNGPYLEVKEGHTSVNFAAEHSTMSYILVTTAGRVSVFKN